MPEQMRSALTALTAKYDRFARRINRAIVILAVGLFLIGGAGYYAIQQQRFNATVDACNQSTNQSEHIVIFLQTLGVPVRVSDLASQAFPTPSPTDCRHLAHQRTGFPF